MTKLKLKLIERQKEMMQQQIQQVMTAKVQEQLHPVEQKLASEPDESFYDPQPEAEVVERPSFKPSKEKATPAFGNIPHSHSEINIG